MSGFLDAVFDALLRTTDCTPGRLINILQPRFRYLAATHRDRPVFSSRSFFSSSSVSADATSVDPLPRFSITLNRDMIRVHLLG